MILFLDTSALVKLYIVEPGSDRMRELVARGEPVAASVLAFAEIHATFARRRREELLQAAELEQLQLAFANDWEELTQVPVGSEVLKLVPDLCARHPLRGADAVHLASALLLRQEGLEITFACSDRNLVGAAAAEGLMTFDPISAEQGLRNAVQDEGGTPAPLGSRLAARFAGQELTQDIPEPRGEEARPTDLE